MPTECTLRLFDFEAVERRAVVASFAGGDTVPSIYSLRSGVRPIFNSWGDGEARKPAEIRHSWVDEAKSVVPRRGAIALVAGGSSACAMGKKEGRG